jgi:hypothetical protein
MASRLKILMSSGSKRGAQIYFSFLSKSQGMRIPSRFPKGAPMEREREPLTGHFYITLDISLYLKGPKKRATRHIPQNTILYGVRTPKTTQNLTAVKI